MSKDETSIYQAEILLITKVCYNSKLKLWSLANIHHG